MVCLGPVPMRWQSCHSEVISIGNSLIGTSFSTTPKISLCRVLASRNSAKHHLDFAQAGETMNTTASQRSVAFRRASCQRSPAARPRSGSTSKNTSSSPQSLSASQCLRPTASISSTLEWLRKMRDIYLKLLSF